MGMNPDGTVILTRLSRHVNPVVVPASSPGSVGRRLKFLNVSDEHIRLFLAIRVERSCKAKDVATVLKELTSLYPALV